MERKALIMQTVIKIQVLHKLHISHTELVKADVHHFQMTYSPVTYMSHAFSVYTVFFATSPTMAH